MNPDAEALRREYNEHYQRPIDHWSCDDLAQAREIVTFVLRHRPAGAPPPHSALDVGCAKGHITEALRLGGLEAHGLDYSDVAIATAKRLFPACTFHHMDGFNPRFERTFDLMLMRGFSGCNTTDMAAIANLVNKYLQFLNPGGCFVLAYSTDFSGHHRPRDTVCWSSSQVEALSAKIDAVRVRAATIPSRHWLRSLKIRVARLLGRRSKYYLYLFYQKPAHRIGGK